MYKKMLAGGMTSTMLLLSMTPVGFAETQSHTDVDMQKKPTDHKQMNRKIS